MNEYILMGGRGRIRAILAMAIGCHSLWKYCYFSSLPSLESDSQKTLIVRLRNLTFIPGNEEAESRNKADQGLTT